MADYQTLPEHGGGKRVDEFLSSALAEFAADVGPDNAGPDNAGPTWGYEDTIALALAYYTEQGRPADAAALRKEAVELFPDSVMLGSFDSPR